MLTKIYHIKAGATEMYDIDARHALKNHGDEWFETADEAVAAKEKADAGLKPVVPTADEAVAPFEAKSKGSGWWAIFDANGKEIGKSMREDDAKAFNDMSDEDKAEYVKALAFES